MLQVCVRAQVAWMRFARGAKEVWTGEGGATVAEYALVLVLVTVAVITVLGELGDALNAKIRAIISSLSSTP